MNIRLASGPHIRTGQDTKNIMLMLIIALLFPTAAGIYFFGVDALWVICVSVASAVAAEWVWQKLAKKPVRIWSVPFIGFLEFNALRRSFLIFCLVLPE